MELPSFSLGLDLDTESEPPIGPIPSPGNSNISPPQDSSSIANLPAIGDDDGFSDRVESELQVMDSDPDSRPEPRQVFRRLRRGPAKEKLSVKKEPESLECEIGDEDIEEFSSQEDIRRDTNPTDKYSICSSSKIPLHTHGIVTNQSSNHCNSQKCQQASGALASANLETNQRGFMFPRLTVSPIRRFQLLDSDSDDSSVSEDLSRGTCKIEKSSSKRQCMANEEKRKVSVCKPLDNDLWKEFCPTKSFRVTTPVLDEFCDEYFQSMKNNGAPQKLKSTFLTKILDGGSSTQNTSSGANFERIQDLTDPLPPAYSYFYHEDQRIQKLVRSRLAYFSPLIKKGGNQLPHESLINYMNQFGNGETSTGKGTQKTNCKSSKRGRNKSKKSNHEGKPHALEGWVNPKSIVPTPRDAGKQRVHATGQAAGHWFTSPEGKKVYISKSGQELIGQTAYRCYRKESGARFRKSKKKGAAKKVKS